MWFILESFLRACICSIIKGIWISLPALALSVHQGEAARSSHTQEESGSILALGPNSFTKVFLPGLRPWGQSIPFIALISVSRRHHVKHKPGSLLYHQSIVHYRDGTRCYIVKALTCLFLCLKEYCVRTWAKASSPDHLYLFLSTATV